MIFTKFCEHDIKMEIVNVKQLKLLNSSENKFSEFATWKWYVIDYSSAYVLVTGNIAVARTIAAAGDNPIQKNYPLTAATQVAFKSWEPFKSCRTEISYTVVDEAGFINIAIVMSN